MIVRGLHVKKHKTLFPQVFDKMRQRHFGAITHARKHRFTGKQSTARHTVNPAYQCSIAPALDTVCVACPVKFLVGLNQFWAKPRCTSIRARFGACADDLLKCPIASE